VTSFIKKLTGDFYMSFIMIINGQIHKTDVDGNMPLLWFLRDTLELTGTKYGCGMGVCGSCTVHLDGRAVRSCLMTVKFAAGKEVTTIEGLSEDGTHPLQIAWLENNVPQCGYCQTGQIMTAAELLTENPSPNSSEINDAMHGNICRCGTYKRIRKAVADAAKQMKEA
jgi:isoquinoline 1-oxidoreductase alpha subunit